MTWRAALCLLTLRSQVDALWPGRDRSSDGIIGDAAHQATPSDHNPDAAGVVHALDLTHDPNSCDIDRLSDALASARDPRISYMIANRMIMSGPGGPSPWSWRDYGGADPHTNHIHISVVADATADSQAPWALPGLEDDMGQLTGEDPWEKGLSQAAELRNGYYAVMAGYQDGRAGPRGVIARLDRIEAALTNPVPAPVALTEQDRQAIITQITAQVTAQVEVTIRRVLGSLDQAAGQ